MSNVFPSIRSLTGIQSYGLAERLLSQAATMVMAVSENVLPSDLSTLHDSPQAFYNPGPNGIEVRIFL
jgi:hypothetical protein